MSTTSVAGSGSGKDSEKDVTLADVVRRLAAIEAIMWPLQPLADQFPALHTRVAKQEQQQAALNIALTRVETVVHDHNRLGVFPTATNRPQTMTIPATTSSPRHTNWSFPSSMAWVTPCHG
jgi:hypothetical protein